MKKFSILLLPIVIVAGFIVISRYQKFLSPPTGEDKVKKPLISTQKSRGKTTRTNKPQRIVSLAPNITEILFALGLDKEVVAVSSDSDYPAGAANKKKVGTFWQPNTEAIIASKPDLVLTLQLRTEQQKPTADSLKRLGYQVLTLKIEKIEELLTAIQKIGVAADCTNRAEELVKEIRNQLNNLQAEFSSGRKVKVLWVVQTDPLRVAGRNTFINNLLELVGGQNAVGPTIQQYPPIGTEELLACGAEIIIQSAMGTADTSKQQKAAEIFWSKFAALPAVRNNRIYVVQPDITLRLGPRLPQGIILITDCLYPDNFRQTSDSAKPDS
ncbi:MAG: ABC transporter substrate-binding protein [Planctomycetota bacterium]|jgi:iron complex transport system substrate-binding protein